MSFYEVDVQIERTLRYEFAKLKARRLCIQIVTLRVLRTLLI